MVLVQGDFRVDGTDIKGAHRRILGATNTLGHRLGRGGHGEWNIHVRLITKMRLARLLVGAAFNLITQLFLEVSRRVGAGISTSGQTQIDRTGSLGTLGTIIAGLFIGHFLGINRMSHIKLYGIGLLLVGEGHLHGKPGLVDRLALPHPVRACVSRLKRDKVLALHVGVQDHFQFRHHRCRERPAVGIGEIHRDATGLLNDRLKVKIFLHHQHTPMVRCVVGVWLSCAAGRSVVMVAMMFLVLFKQTFLGHGCFILRGLLLEIHDRLASGFDRRLQTLLGIAQIHIGLPGHRQFLGIGLQ